MKTANPTRLQTTYCAVAYWVAALLFAGAAVLAACGPDKKQTTPAVGVDAVNPDTQTRQSAKATRIIAIGDLHGDADAAVRVLRLAGLLDETGNWVGGTSVVVQTGDILDRGDAEAEILSLFSKLETQALAAGGAFHSLLGNHEIMNFEGNMAYVSAAGMMAFSNLAAPFVDDPRLDNIPPLQKQRAAAFLPGGPLARAFGNKRVIAIEGETVFVHGGVLPSHVAYGIDRINLETQAWIRGDSHHLPPPMTQPDAPTWYRRYSEPLEPDAETCETLRSTLDSLRAKRMVVGHSVQDTGINSACGGAVWRIDAGMSSSYGNGTAQALELSGTHVTVLH